MELVAIVDDHEAGTAELLLLEAVQQLLEQRRVGFECRDDRTAGGNELRQRFIGLLGGGAGLQLFHPLLGLDRGVLGFVQGPLAVGEGRVEFPDVGPLGEHRAHDVRELVHGDRLFAEFRELLVRGLEFRGRRLEVGVPLLDHVIEMGPGTVAADGFDAAHARRDGPFALDLEKPDLAGVADMGAAAKFHRGAVQFSWLAADLHHPDQVAVLVAEELHDVLAALDRGVRDFLPRHRELLVDGTVDHFLHLRDLLRSDRGAVEVEAQAELVDRGTLLRGVLRNDLVERPVEQVGRAVVGLDRPPAGGVELERDGVAGFDRRAAVDDVGAGLADLLDAGDSEFGSVDYESSRISRLAAHLRVEDGLVGDDEQRVFLRMDFEDGGLDLIGVEAAELGDGFCRDVEGADDSGFLGGAGALLLLPLAILVTILVESEVVLGAKQLREVDRKPEGVFEFERDVAREREIDLRHLAFQGFVRIGTDRPTALSVEGKHRFDV